MSNWMAIWIAVGLCGGALGKDLAPLEDAIPAAVKALGAGK